MQTIRKFNMPSMSEMEIEISKASQDFDFFFRYFYPIIKKDASRLLHKFAVYECKKENYFEDIVSVGLMKLYQEYKLIPYLKERNIFFGKARKAIRYAMLQETIFWYSSARIDYTLEQSISKDSTDGSELQDFAIDCSHFHDPFKEIQQEEEDKEIQIRRYKELSSVLTFKELEKLGISPP